MISFPTAPTRNATGDHATRGRPDVDALALLTRIAASGGGSDAPLSVHPTETAAGERATEPEHGARISKS